MKTQETAEAYQKIQDEQVPWVKHNFPGRPPHQPLMGITEELGEFVDALEVYAHQDMMDALADIMIYFCDYASACEIKVSDLYIESLNYFENRLQSISILGKLHHHRLKLDQGIRKNEDHAAMTFEYMAKLFAWCHVTCLRKTGKPLVLVTTDVWENIVKKRDWQANKDSGGAAADVPAERT